MNFRNCQGVFIGFDPRRVLRIFNLDFRASLFSSISASPNEPDRQDKQDSGSDVPIPPRLRHSYSSEDSCDDYRTRSEPNCIEEQHRHHSPASSCIAVRSFKRCAMYCAIGSKYGMRIKVTPCSEQRRVLSKSFCFNRSNWTWLAAQ